MELLEKLKNALFEEDDEDEVKESKKEKVKINEDKIVKKIDVTRTTKEEPKEELPSYGLQDFKIEEKPKGPIIFDDEDFLSDTKELTFREIPKKEEKILYGGYETKELDKTKEKFHPSPIISPVYGVLDKNYIADENKKGEKKSLDHLFVEERKKEITFDTVREKAYGEALKKEESVIINEDPLLYEMQDHDETPGIEKITIGDAEEYFEDLGLEYEVDYKDIAKSQNMTRSKKNKELTETIEEEIKEDSKIEEEIKSLKEIEKDVVPNIENDYVEPEEKNLYDLIDMMYESKEWY